MLKCFEVSNFKGFNEKFTMDLSRIKSYEFNENCVSNNIARFVQCYGPNGSGKSNLGISILDLSTHLTDNLVNKIYYLNYLNAENSSPFAQFKYTFQFGERNVVYEYWKTGKSVPTRESLTIDGQLSIYLDRESEEMPIVRLAGAESLVLDDIKGNQISIVKFVARNSILLKNEINETFSKFIDFVEHMLYFRSLSDTGFIGFKPTAESILDHFVNNQMIPELEAFFRKMGVDYELVAIEDPDAEKRSIGVKFGSKVKRLWEVASTGTRALAFLFYWYKQITVQTSPSLIFIDEFDAFYHFKISETISKMLAELKEHQIILTTHNTGLFSNEISRPDCNFILDNNKINPIYLLTSKELRSAHNIEKIYRAGGFDAG